MPIYEFQCQKCDADFELLVRSMSSSPKVRCPECGGRKARRKLSVFGMTSSRAGGGPRSSGSGCGSCRATSCAGCRK